MTTRRRPIALAVILVLYLIAALLIGFWSTPVDAPAHAWLFSTLRELRLHGMPDFVDYDFVESAANVLFFVPLGILLAALLPRRLWPLAIIIGAAFSCAIELGQYLFLPARFASLGDVAANTVGAIVGAVITLVVRAIAGRRAR